MKKVLFLFLFAFVVGSLAAQVVVYEDTAELEWDAVTVDENGDPLLPGDVVDYEVYYYDRNNPPVDVQDVAQLNLAGSTATTSFTITFPERREWVVGVRATITDGGGTAGTPSSVAWSNIEEDVDVATMGGPFFYTPLVQSLNAPDNLRDRRY